MNNYKTYYAVAIGLFCVSAFIGFITANNIKPIKQHPEVFIQDLKDETTATITELNKCYSYPDGSVNKYLCIKRLIPVKSACQFSPVDYFVPSLKRLK